MKNLLIFALACLLAAPVLRAADDGKIPPDEKEAKARLDKTPRHGEFVDITVPGAKAPLKSFIVFPEVKDKAPVIIVISEIYGLSDWIRSVADQLAADGFIAIAPDLISGLGPNGGGTDSIASRDDVVKLIRSLKNDQVVADLNAVREYAMKLPAASGKTASIGFCWGGGASFMYATAQPELSAAVVYYGTSPSNSEDYQKIKAPVQGHYGGNDARVNMTIPTARENMSKLNKTYDPHVYEGAGHGFLRAQSQSEANAKAAKEAWPLTIAFLKEHMK
jgi:carboxymethylenebutenolidase